MTTGNLRRAAKKLLGGLIPRYDGAALRDAFLLGVAGFSFFAGAVIGGLSTGSLHDRALRSAVLLLLSALIRIVLLIRRPVG